MYFVVYILQRLVWGFRNGWKGLVLNLTFRFYQLLFWLKCVNFLLLCRIAAISKRQKLTATCLLPIQAFSFWNDLPVEYDLVQI